MQNRVPIPPDHRQSPAEARATRRRLRWTAALALTAAACALVVGPRPAHSQATAEADFVYEVSEANQRIEMTVNTSRVLRLGTRATRVAVSNPQVVQASVLNPTEVQIVAVSPGLTQVALWGEDGRLHSLDVIVMGDARTLNLIIQTTFPATTVRAIPVQDGVVLTGYVDDPSQITSIVQVAQLYHPNVINAIQVGGVRQVLLRVKVMEVQRSRLRALGFNWFNIGQDNFVTSTPGNVASVASTGGEQAISAPFGGPPGVNFLFDPTNPTVTFGILEPNNVFLSFLRMLREENLLKILAEPNLVTVSGRPASFVAGGSFPILVPQGFGATSVQFEEFGVILEFVPIVMGDGRIRLEVRPEVSERDFSAAIETQGFTVPGLSVRSVDTAVELCAGQTLAIAGLINERQTATAQRIPLIGELPLIGAAFRRVEHEVSEVELLVLVTPELVGPLEPWQVPPGPGFETVAPDDFELFIEGHLEVPRRCGPDCPICDGHGCPVLPPSAPFPGAAYPVGPQGYGPPVQQLGPAIEVPMPGQDSGWTAPGSTSPEAMLHTAPGRGAAAGAPPVTGPTPSGQQPGAAPPGLIGPYGYDAAAFRSGAGQAAIRDEQR